jgi:hypothetical protein
MDAAFDRLTQVQKDNINKYMFEFAYNCVIRSSGKTEYLKQIIREETRNSPHLEKDLLRYCKLVNSVK